MQPGDTLQSVTLSLTREEADALLALLLRAPETESLSAERIEQLLFRILRKLPIADVLQKNADVRQKNPE